MKFKYIYAINPIDYWEGAQIASYDETEAVLAQMPEEPVGDIVFKVYMPAPSVNAIFPVWLCKADNNGTTYLFSQVDLDLDCIKKIMNQEVI